MLASPTRHEIDHRTTKLLVGLLALGLGPLAQGLSADALPSISASYHQGGLARDVFVGIMVATAALMATYNGESKAEMIMSKVAAGAALLVALCPCDIGDARTLTGRVHGGAAVIMFTLLAVFCFMFRRRAREKTPAAARRRVYIYTVCGWLIAGVLVGLLISLALGDAWASRPERLLFFGELGGLLPFGVSWLTASRVLPWISAREERYSPLRANPTAG